MSATGSSMDIALLPLLLMLLLGQSVLTQQTAQFTRGVPSAERSGSDFMASHYQRKQQDEFRLMVNCSPSLAKPQLYDVESRSSHRVPSYPDKLTWLRRTQEPLLVAKDSAPLLAVELLAPACTTAKLLSPSLMPLASFASLSSSSSSSSGIGGGGELVVFVDAVPCGLARTVDAVRRLLPETRVLLLLNAKDAAPAGHTEPEASPDSSDVSLVIYEQAVLGRQLLAEMRQDNRSCTVSLMFRSGGIDSLINKTSVLFVSVSFILLMIISLSWLIFYYVQRFRYLHAKERLSRRLGNAAKKALTKIPVKVLKTGDKDFHWIGDQCAVCIEPYRCGESVRILPCKHFYHKSCIDPWLLDQRSCPLCKLDILKACGLTVHRGSQASLLEGQLSAEPSHSHAASAVGLVAVAPVQSGSVALSSLNRGGVTVQTPLELGPSLSTASPSNSHSDEGGIQVTIQPPDVQYHHSNNSSVQCSGFACHHEPPSASAAASAATTTASAASSGAAATAAASTGTTAAAAAAAAANRRVSSSPSQSHSSLAEAEVCYPLVHRHHGSG